MVFVRTKNMKLQLNHILWEINGIYKVYHAYKVYRQNDVEVKREFLSRDLYK